MLEILDNFRGAVVLVDISEFKNAKGGTAFQ